MLKTRWDHFEESIFARMSKAAQKHHAVNLAQGFPDFDGPAEVVQGAIQAMKSGKNQYAPSSGIAELRTAISEAYSNIYKLNYDPDHSVGVFSGATEAIWCCVLSLVNRNEDVVTFEPFYDSYQGAVHAAYGNFKTVPLDPITLELDKEIFLKTVNENTKLLILNTPHNPTGKVFSKDELTFISECAQKYNFYVLSDEVYEHLVYDDHMHSPIATLDSMQERTVTISSTSKTYGMTGWKIGYACGPQHLIAAMLKVHQFTTFCSATPLQYGMIDAFKLDHVYYKNFRKEYQQRRDFLVKGLRSLGWKCEYPQGSYFVIAEVPGLKNDLEYAMELTKNAKVACIPISVFCLNSKQNFLRFSFCKTDEVLSQAISCLESYLR